MYKARSKRERRIRFFLTYTIVPVLIVSLATLLVLMIQGYRFDANQQRVFQAGLVQFDSKPSGATISFDGEELASRTRARLNIVSGVHTIGMTLSGYVPWQKTVTVNAGEVLWLTYPRLVPETVTPEAVYTYRSAASTLAHPDDELLGVHEDKSTPRFDSIKATNGTPERTRSELPPALYDELDAGNWQATSWSESARYVSFRYQNSEQTRWFVLDRADEEQSFSLTRESGITTIDQVLFDAKDDRWIYLLADGTLRRFDREQLSLSRPIARDVVSINQSKEAVVSFISRSDKLSRAGYVTPGAQSAKYAIIPSVQNPRAVAVTEYDRRQFIATLSGDKLTISRTSLHASDSDRELEMQTTFSVSLPKTTSRLSVSPEGRFIAARDGRTVHVYDLELNQMSQVNLSSKSAPLRWLGDFHIHDVVDGEFVMQEFDGTNVTPVSSALPSAAVFTSDGRFIYTLAKLGDTVQVVRFELRA